MKSIFKKLTHFILATLLIMGMSVAIYGADDITPEKPLKCGRNAVWQFDQDTKTLTISGTGKIRETNDWKTYKIKNIVIEEGITRIDSSTFYNLRSVENISIPDSVTRIGYGAFAKTSIKSITIGENVTKLGSGIFSRCKKLTEVNWNAEVIPYETFYRCKSLTKVNIGSNVKQIGSYAFSRSAITELVVPDTVTTISRSAFACAYKLESLKLSDNIKNLPSHFIYDCNSLTELTLSKNLEKISNFAFSYSHLKKIKIPNSVNFIGKKAFYSAYDVEEVILPDSIKSIKDELFSDCEKLSKVDIGKKVTYIGESAFANCKNLKSIVIPGNVKVIGYAAFQNSGLEKVTLKDGVKKLDFWAFNNCNKLKTITIPKSVVIIQEHALTDCNKLTSINVDKDNAAYSSIDGCLTNKSKTKLYTVPAGKKGTFSIPSTISKIETSAFNGCSKITIFDASSNYHFAAKDGILYNSSMKTLVRCPSVIEGTIDIPDTVTRIEECAFSYSKATKINIPDSVKSIGYCAFEYCNNLKTIIIPSSIKTVSNASFWGCENLRKVTIEKGVKTIGRNAFHECSNLKKVIIPTSVNKIGKTSFSSCYKVTFYCKKSSFAMSYAVNRWAIDYKLI